MNLPFYAPLIAGPRIFNLPQLLLLFHLHLAGCPSGQRELTVNQPSSTSWVRIPHPPLKTARIVKIRAVFCFAAGARSSCCPRLHRHPWPHRRSPTVSPPPPVTSAAPARRYVATRPRLHRHCPWPDS